jgi:hypothetical protein
MGQFINVSGDYNIRAVDNGTIKLDTGLGVGRVVVTGDLEVRGTTTTVGTVDLIVRDNIIVLNSGETGAGVTAPDFNSGIQIDRGYSNQNPEDTNHPPDVLITWDESLGTFILKNDNWTSQSPSSNLESLATNAINTYGADLTLVAAGSGVVTVAGTDDYETNVLDYDKLGTFFEITTVQRSFNISTVTTVQPHTLVSGDRILVDCDLDSTFTELQSVVDEVIDNNTITYSNPGNNVSTKRSSGIIKPIPVRNDDIIPNMRAVVDYGVDLQLTYKTYADISSRNDNVLYVAKNGSDDNDGTTMARPKLTIKSAVSIATLGTTIFVKSGDYTEDNPIRLAEGVTIIGDNLRAVTVRPAEKTQDLFWVNNACYLANMTFKDHEAPSAAVAFPTDGAVGVVHTSPYVQNCTSMTTTGTGMRVDGNHVSGLRSMVVDAYTQYNQGGIGIHMLNRGNTQLVSVFTIGCDIGFLCETGGFCSITNSNSSFGNVGIKADGVSTVLYTGKLVADTTGSTFVLNGLTTRPNVGDAVQFGESDGSTEIEYYTVRSSTPFTSAGAAIEQPNYDNESADRKNARQTVLNNKNKVLTDMINFLNETYPDYDFNQFKATRDGGIIIDAAVDDMILDTNYKTVQAGIAYYRASASNLITNQLEQTLAAINFIKSAVLALLVTSPEKITIENNFNTVISIIEEGVGAAPAYVFNPPTAFDQSRFDMVAIIQANRQFLIEEGIAFLTINYPEVTYNEATCRRDIGFIVDAVTYDVLYLGNSQTADAADEYYNGANNLQILPDEQKQPTIDTFEHIKEISNKCVRNVPVLPVLNTAGVTQDTSLSPVGEFEADTILDPLFDIVTNLIENAYTSELTLDERNPDVVPAGTTVSFYQYSLASSSGHTFEWVGAGTNINTALPYLGGIPDQPNEVVEVNGGKVYFTSTDQRGDFRIGEELVINRNTGTISGRTFARSLYSILTPYILAIGE